MLQNSLLSVLLTGKKNPIAAPVIFPSKVIAPIMPELKPGMGQYMLFNRYI